MPILKPPKFLNMAEATTNTTDFGLSIDDFNTIFGESEWTSAKNALKNSDLFAIINQLSNDLASVSIMSDDKKVQMLMDNPTKLTSSHSFFQSIFAQLLLAGEAFVYQWRNTNGLVTKWEFIRPSQISVNRNHIEDGLLYNVTFEDPNVATKLSVAQSDILHFKIISVDGGIRGVSPLDALRTESEIQKSSNSLTLSALRNSMNVNGILKIEGQGLLSNKIKEARSRSVMKQMTGGPLVLDDLESFTPVEIKNNVDQLLSQTDWTTTQFAKVYGIPDSYLGGTGDQQSNLDQIKSMYTNALYRYLQPFVSEICSKNGGNITIDISNVVDPSGESYMKIIGSLVKYGALAPNQATFILQQKGIIPNDIPVGDFQNVKGGGQNTNS